MNANQEGKARETPGRRPRSLFFAIAMAVCIGLIVPAVLIGVVLIGVREPQLAALRQQQELQARLDVLAQSLAELVWSLDVAAAREVVQAALKSPDVVGVRVTDVGQGKALVDVHLTERQHGKLMSGERDIVRRGKLIGRVAIEIDDRVAAAALREQRQLYLLTVSGQVLFSLALIVLLLNARVARPLRELGRFAGDVGAGQFSAALVHPHDDEIGRLGERLTNMRDALQQLFDEQRSLLDRVRDEEAHAQRQARFYAALSRSNQLIVREHDEPTLYAEICRICVETGHATMACIWLLDGDNARIAASAGPVEGMLSSGALQGDPSTTGVPPLVALALRDGQHAVSNEFLTDPRTAPYHARAAAHGVHAAAVFPVHRGAGVVGAVSLHSSEAGVFDDAVVELLDEMARDLSFALANTDREAARVAALREVEAGLERQRRVFGAAPVSIVISTLGESGILEANAAACERYGFSRDEMIGRSWPQLGVGLAPSERARLTQALERDGAVRDFETRVSVRSGELRDVLMNADHIEFGGRDCMMTIATDITERKRMEHALRESEARLSGIVETAMDAIVTIDTQQRIVVFNRAAAQMFRIAAAQVLGGPLDRFIPPRLRAVHRDHLVAYAASGESPRRMGEARRLSGLRADGEEFPIAASISRSGEGEHLLMTVVARDTTTELESERARQARLDAEAASRAKTDFLSRMSHELRTPLNAVLGFSQLLQSDPQAQLSERQQAQVESIRQAGCQLLALINDVLDVSRIEAGRLQMDARSVDLGGILDEVHGLLREQAERHGVVLDAAYRKQPPVRVWGDPVRVRQVLLNVVGNAVKYNRPGGVVRIESAVLATAVQVQVADTGLGMTRDQLDHLYEPFNRLGRERGGIEGTGIGMALSRQLLELMNGAIAVESKAGHGTTVRVTLPLPLAGALPERPAAAVARRDESHGEPAGVLLYIEDNPINAMLVEQLLAPWTQLRLAQASDGGQGIELARRLKPDVVLLDMRLPDMDGSKVLEVLRADPATRDLCIVALSASAMPEDIALARRCGASDYWTKPLDADRFLADVRALLPVAVR